MWTLSPCWRSQPGADEVNLVLRRDSLVCVCKFPHTEKDRGVPPLSTFSAATSPDHHDHNSHRHRKRAPTRLFRPRSAKALCPQSKYCTVATCSFRDGASHHEANPSKNQLFFKKQKSYKYSYSSLYFCFDQISFRRSENFRSRLKTRGNGANKPFDDGMRHLINHLSNFTKIEDFRISHLL